MQPLNFFITQGDQWVICSFLTLFRYLKVDMHILRNAFARYRDKRIVKIGNLCDLSVLKLGRPLLEILSPSIGYLRNVGNFQLQNWQKLTCFPDTIRLLTQMRELKIMDGVTCTALTTMCHGNEQSWMVGSNEISIKGIAIQESWRGIRTINRFETAESVVSNRRFHW